MAAKKAKTYTVTKKVPAVFESDDGKTIVFHDVGATVSEDDPGVARALQTHPDCFA